MARLVKTLKKTLAKAMAPKAAKKALTKKPAPSATKLAKVEKVTKPTKVAKGAAKASVTKAATTKTATKAVVSASAESKVAAGKKGKAGKGEKEVVALVQGKAAKIPKKLAADKPKEKSAAAIRAAEAAGEKLCREAGCENIATTKGYCRLDYIKNWKKIKRKEMILKEGKLNQYIEELVSKYPDKYIDIIRQDLSTEVNFTKIIHDLELDESIDDLDYDGDSIDSLIGSIGGKGSEDGDEGDF